MLIDALLVLFLATGSENYKTRHHATQALQHVWYFSLPYVKLESNNLETQRRTAMLKNKTLTKVFESLIESERPLPPIWYLPLNFPERDKILEEWRGVNSYYAEDASYQLFSSLFSENKMSYNKIRRTIRAMKKRMQR